ncbi:MAG: thiamine diphosphokinase [Actinobacteria bacterium]|nr:thiamine diphosphokinase [Actinomycetota bacterium]
MGWSPDVVVLLGGADVDEQRPLAVGTPGLVIAADAGLHRAGPLGLAVDHVVGDLDSVDPDQLAAAEAAGATVHRHEADKDATDAELALRLTADLAGDGRPSLLVIGDRGGRLDLLLTDLLLGAGPLTEAFDTTVLIDDATVAVARPGRPVTIAGAPGEQVSLLPLHGRARGVSTDGLRWPLVDADLVEATTRGVSNELVGERASVVIGEGVVLVVQQGIVAPVADARTGIYDPTPRG